MFGNSALDIEGRLKAKKSILKSLTKSSNEFVTESKIPNSLLINLSTKKFNEKFSTLSEGDKKKFKSLLNTDSNTLENEMSSLVEEVTEKIDTLITETNDTGLLVKLQETRKKITNSETNKVSLHRIKELNKTL